MELFAQQQQGWAMNPYMQAGQNPYSYGGGGGGSGSGGGGGGGGANGGANGNMQQNPYAYAQHPMMFSNAATCEAATSAYGQLALPHAPPAPDRATGGLRPQARLGPPRPASARPVSPLTRYSHVANYCPLSAGRHAADGSNALRHADGPTNDATHGQLGKVRQG